MRLVCKKVEDEKTILEMEDDLKETGRRDSKIWGVFVSAFLICTNVY